MTIKEAVAKISEQLNNTDCPIREARLLVSLVTGFDMAGVIANSQLAINPLSLPKLEEFAKRRASGEPFAYIAGEKEFHGKPFYVDKNVLIPRADTEILVNFALGNETTVLDLCTGSGCIAVTLAGLMPWAEVTAVDVSKKALEIASKNALRHDVKIEFIEKDILKHRISFKKKFMLAVCNPPYIRPDVIEKLETDVKDFEPRLALDGGTDGLVFYRKIAKDAPLFLNVGGRLCLEIGFDQAEQVTEILQENFENIQVIKDYAGEDRVVMATLKKSENHNHNGHRERLRKRFVAEGIDSFQPHEIMELLLCYAVPRRNVNGLAHYLINQFGSVSKVLDAPLETLMEKGTLTENGAAFMKLLPEISRIYRKDKWKDKVNLTNTFVAGQYAVDLFEGLNYEVFYVICLDNSGGLIASEKISEGTINEAPIYPRLVVEAAIRCKANKVILAHNHPSGNKNPSWVDIKTTEKIQMALENIDIEFVDHFIVAGETFTSINNVLEN